MKNTWTSKYFYGNEISNYGLANGFVDYRTLSKAFDSVLANGIIEKTWGTCGEWERISGGVDNSEEIEQAREEIENRQSHISDIEDELDRMADTDENETGRLNRFELIEKLQDEIKDLENRIDELEEEQDEEPEIFQYYIVDNNGAEILQEFGEILYYNEELDLYVWGVDHFGTSWDYVLTNIRLELDENQR